MPQRFPYLTALQSKFKLSPTELAQRRGVIGIITGTLGRFRKPPRKPSVLRATSVTGLPCGELSGKEGGIPRECLFLRHRSELRAHGGGWDGEATTNPIFLVHSQPLPGAAAPAEAELQPELPAL